MEDKLFYICNTCRKLFEDKDLALRCEHNDDHKAPAALSVCNVAYEQGDVYPSYVWLKMTDGKVYSYQRMRDIDEGYLFR